MLASGLRRGESCWKKPIDTGRMGSPISVGNTPKGCVSNASIALDLRRSFSVATIGVEANVEFLFIFMYPRVDGQTRLMDRMWAEFDRGHDPQRPPLLIETEE